MVSQASNGFYGNKTSLLWNSLGQDGKETGVDNTEKGNPSYLRWLVCTKQVDHTVYRMTNWTIFHFRKANLMQNRDSSQKWLQYGVAGSETWKSLSYSTLFAILEFLLMKNA